MPFTGELEGVYYALGFTGHGVARGRHRGMQIANPILDGTVKELQYNNDSFPTALMGLYNGIPWFLPLIGLWQWIFDWMD